MNLSRLPHNAFAVAVKRGDLEAIRFAAEIFLALDAAGDLKTVAISPWTKEPARNALSEAEVEELNRICISPVTTDWGYIQILDWAFPSE